MQDNIKFLKPNLLRRRVGNKVVKISARAWRTMKKKVQSAA